MKGADSAGPAGRGRPADTNGTHRAAAKRNGGAPKAPAGTGAPAGAPEQLASPVAAIEATAIDAPMWPLHPAAWFQPDVAPSPPVWSGLSIERRNRMPVADFLPSGAAPLDCPGARDSARQALTPAADPAVPESGLAPLGWDPRSVCWKGEGK